ncbi:Pr6Pr family membrane protein [Devosia sp. A449]
MNVRAPIAPARLLLGLGLIFGVGGLGLQFSLSMSNMLSSGRDLPGSLGSFFSYYTILTNIALVLIYLSEILPARWLELFRSPLLRGLMAANIALVSIFVFFVLRHLSVLTDLWLLADNLLHYLCPLLYLLWWGVAQRHGRLVWRNLPLMLVPTLVYFVYAMARGAWVQEYPYPILNAIKLGYPQVALNAVYMTALLAVLCLIIIGLDQWLARPSRTIRS